MPAVQPLPHEQGAMQHTASSHGRHGDSDPSVQPAWFSCCTSKHVYPRACHPTTEKHAWRRK
eukprot:3100022-Amphidinium_carterae.1